MAIGYKCAGLGCGIVRAERWTGPCPGCGRHYNCQRVASADGVEHGPPPRGQVMQLSDVSGASMERISCGEQFPGVDRVLGIDPLTGLGGVAAKGGQAIQLYGGPGTGKSTLLLQICREWTKQRYQTLYVAGEESLQQIKNRADRLGHFNAKMTVIDEQDLDSILYALDDVQPTFAVIDSIQTVSVEEYANGSLTAIKIAARELYRFTQARGIGLVVVTQMNKTADDFAGPKELEHILDTSLHLRLEHDGTRILSCDTKNRFGMTPSFQRFKMTDGGLVEVAEPPPPTPPEPKKPKSTPPDDPALDPPPLRLVP